MDKPYSLSDVYRYISQEIEYTKRRWMESTNVYQQAYWLTRWYTLFEVGTEAGMQLEIPHAYTRERQL